MYVYKVCEHPLIIVSPVGSGKNFFSKNKFDPKTNEQCTLDERSIFNYANGRKVTNYGEFLICLKTDRTKLELFLIKFAEAYEACVPITVSPEVFAIIWDNIGTVIDESYLIFIIPDTTYAISHGLRGYTERRLNEDNKISAQLAELLSAAISVDLRSVLRKIRYSSGDYCMSLC